MAFEGQDEDRPFSNPLIRPRKRSARKIMRGLLATTCAALVVLSVGGIAAYLVLKNDVLGRSKLPNPSLGAAKNCLEDKNYGCAAENYEGYLEKYPNDATTTAILAITLTRDGQHKAAIYYYKRAITLGVSTYDLYANYANSLDAVGDLDESIKMNYAALHIVPKLVDVRGALADQLVKRGRAQEGLKLLEDFDESLVQDGYSPYFTDQIERIKNKMGTTSSNLSAATNDLHSNKSNLDNSKMEIHLEADRGTFFIPVSINKTENLEFTIDSGASDVTIPANVARRLSKIGRLDPNDFIGQGIYTLADGSQSYSQVFLIRSLRVGNIEIKNVRGVITKNNGSLLLGQSFLRRFKSWSIDNRRKVLILQR